MAASDPLARCQPIVERLRRAAEHAGNEWAYRPLAWEAADRIEALEAALRDMLDSEALNAMEGCDCEECAPIARANAILGVAREASKP